MGLWISRVVLLSPAVLLLAAAVPRFQSGLAIDAAFPVPVMIILNAGLPGSAYRAAADVLAAADSRDGLTLIQRAEIASYTDMPAQEVVNLLRQGLSHSPSSVRGWLLLAEQLKAQDPKGAADALANSLLLGPNDFFVAGRRARAAAFLWDLLPDDAREAALRQVRLLWSTEALNRQIEPLMQTSGGGDLLTRAFADEPDELRALNRWVASARRGAAGNQ